MTAVNQALAEVNEQLHLIEPVREGLEDLRRLNLEPETRRVVSAQIQFFQSRFNTLTAAKSALEALLEDGYPDLQVEQIDSAAMADLEANMATLSAAFATFASGQAESLGLSAGPVEPK